MDQRLDALLFSMLASVAPEHGCAYVAGPLATGRNYYILLAEGKRDLADRSRSDNEPSMRRFVSNLRTQLPYPVIDPGVLRVGHWNGKEMGDFFLRVIDQFAKEVWFMDGWEFSRGATKEASFCLANGIRCLDQDGKEMDFNRAISRIEETVRFLRNLGLDTDIFAGRVRAIQAVANRNGNVAGV